MLEVVLVTARALAAILSALPPEAADATVVADAVHRWAASPVTGVQVLRGTSAETLHAIGVENSAAIVVLECDL